MELENKEKRKVFPILNRKKIYFYSLALKQITRNLQWQSEIEQAKYDFPFK